MNYFFDTEFIERVEQRHNSSPVVIDLISIGIVSESGREFYHWNSDAPWPLIHGHEWLSNNVMQYVPDCKSQVWLRHSEFADKIRDYIGDDKHPVFWADWGAYDWVVFCSLFGSMCDLPDNFPMFVRDIQQAKQFVGHLKDLPTFISGCEHNALSDAYEAKARYEYLLEWEGE